MRLFVDGNSILKERSGVGQFTKNLLEAYSKKFPTRTVIIFGFKFITKGKPLKPIKETSNVRYRIARLLPGRAYNLLFKYNLGLPLDVLFRARPSDVFLFPNFVRFPLLYSKRSLLAIYDLSFVYYSQFTHPKDLPYKQKYVPRSIKKAQRIITISQNSKKELMEYYRVPESKISIVYPGVDTSVFYPRSNPSINKALEKYNLPSKYILFTGTIEPRKNVSGLLEAYEKLDDKLKKEYALVLVGGKGWKDGPITTRIKALQKTSHIIQLGYVDDADLPTIFSGASIFVFPSHYEGFGMPIVEAMACGVPAICSNNSSMIEAAGKAGLLVNPDKNDEIRLAMEKLLNDKALREKMIKLGLQHVVKFSWENSAQQLQNSIDKL